MSKSDRVSGVLLASKRRIARRWTKGSWKSIRPAEERFDGYGQKSYCLEGSCTGGDKTPKTAAQREAFQYLKKAIDKYTGNRYSSIPAFNDASSTTHEDVKIVTEMAYKMAKDDGK